MHNASKGVGLQDRRTAYASLTNADIWRAAAQAALKGQTSVAQYGGLVNREPHGLFKVVADARTDEVLGVHMVAENAGDVIYAGVARREIPSHVPRPHRHICAVPDHERGTQARGPELYPRSVQAVVLLGLRRCGWIV